MSYFRFEDLEIWKSAIALGNGLFDVAERAAEKRLYRFAEQLNGASISISNNIAEGSGSASKKDFANYLMIARKSLYECVNLLHVYQQRSLISEEERDTLRLELLKLSRSIYAFRKKLLE